MQLTIDVWFTRARWDLRSTLADPPPTPEHLFWPPHPGVDNLLPIEEAGKHLGRTVFALRPTHQEAVRLLQLSGTYADDPKVTETTLDWMLMTTWPLPPTGMQGCWQKQQPRIRIFDPASPKCRLITHDQGAEPFLWEGTPYVPDECSHGFDAVYTFNPSLMSGLLCALCLEGFLLGKKHGIIS